MSSRKVMFCNVCNVMKKLCNVMFCTLSYQESYVVYVTLPKIMNCYVHCVINKKFCNAMNVILSKVL